MTIYYPIEEIAVIWPPIASQNAKLVSVIHECSELIPVESPGYHPAKLRIRAVLRPASEHVVKFQKESPSRFLANAVIWLRFSTKAVPTRDAPPIERSDGTLEEWPLDERRKLFETLFAESCERAIQLFVVAMNIARPGVFKLGAGICLMDDHPVLRMEPILHEIDVVFREAIERGWPDFIELDPVKTWKWASRHAGFLEGTSQTPIGRALNAYSYFFGETFSGGEIEELVWSLIGLEALYARNEDSIVNQIVGKCALLIPGAEKYQKQIKDLYNFRSRLLHGQRNIPNKFNAGDATSEIDKVQSDYYIMQFLGAAILVASLQYLVRHDLNSLDFSYRLAQGIASQESRTK
ncbi:hypothetical protein [Hypericibacter terrae]|uniref:hypothetical protein n=1 Tax=Hypericibacter terrae TaxID=2602015 RepID=UPI001248982E|nr:hypothetical protein [Hypericibacter terrae]